MMYWLRGRRRNRYLLIFTAVIVCFLYSFSKWMYSADGRDWDYPDVRRSPCNFEMKLVTDERPIVGILGPRGSGVYWLRHMVEQMTGIYTGSPYNEYPETFKGEGETKQVATVMAHRIEDISGVISAGIVVYRRMQETVQTQYGLQHPSSDDDSHAPLSAYYGKEWQGFVMRHSQEWADTYQGFLEAGVPLLVLNYEEMEDPSALRSQLLKISNFLHVPIKSSVFECVVSRSQEFDMKPPPLKEGVQPYSLLEHAALDHLIRLENHVHEQIRVTRDRYRPKVR